MSIPIKQEPKYNVDINGIYNRQTKKVIPEEEPIFVLRASDKHAVKVLKYYEKLVSNGEHTIAIKNRLKDFIGFSKVYPNRMKEPDTDLKIFEEIELNSGMMINHY